LNEGQAERWVKMSEDCDQKYEMPEMKELIEEFDGTVYTQKEGEMIYFGRNVWHEVRTEERTISWATSLFTTDDLDDLYDDWEIALERQTSLVSAVRALYE